MANYCVSCGKPLPIGSESDYCGDHGGPPLTPEATIRCPYCSEVILALAKKCKHCGEFIAHRQSAQVATARKSQPVRAGDIICPNPQCGYQGPPRREARGSCLVGLILLLFFLLPGILYFMFKRGYRYYCPRCGIQIGADV